MVSVGCAALAAFVPACGSSDSGGGGGTAGASAGGAGPTAGAGGGNAAGSGSMNTAKPGNAANGATLFTKMTNPGACNSCHGDDAGGGLGPNISGATPAGLGGWTEEQFYQVVRNSKASTGAKVCTFMPPYLVTDLSDQDIADIFAFTQSKMVTTVNQGAYAMTDSTCTAK